MKGLLFGALLLLFSSSALSSEIVVVLDLKFVKETEDVAALMCYGENESDCHPWAYFYVFDAKVNKVISGELDKKRFRVKFGRHALRKGSHKNLVVTLSPLTGSADAEYQIREVGQMVKMYCFSVEGNKHYNVRDESNEADLNCYEAQ